ncbi:autophagy protein Apg6-domain-containing protein [Chlamydoabsidia padenii]|nr:autophagy protein Apg6-domain-containing protein [Chlamydoabsidia padenii]
MPSFVCQRCKQPLRIDDSLADLDESSADLLLASLSSEEQSQRQKHSHNHDIHSLSPTSLKATATDTSPVSRKHIHRHPMNDSFVMLSNSQVHAPSSTLSHTRLSMNRNESLKQTDSSTTGSSIPFSPTAPSVINNLHPTSTPTITTTGEKMKKNGIDLPTSSNMTPTKSTSLKVEPSISQATITAPANVPDHHRNNSLSHRLKVATLLFDVMSSKSNVDHPMCQECTDMMLESLERQLNDVGRERDCYLDFLKKIKQQQPSAISSIEPSTDYDQLAAQVERLMKQEQEAQATLDTMHKEKQQLEQTYRDLQQEEKELEKEEQVFWDECNNYQIQYQQFQNERDAINLKYDHDVRQLERLQKTVVYNDAFCIVQDGPFGTINGYRLGRLGSHPVEWNEINAAWGQTLLLLYTVANKLKFQFQTYRLVPMGSFSKVEKVDGDVVVAYELYGSSDYALNRLFLNRRFDHAMVAMLNCLKQLSDYAEQKDRSIRLPYRINKDKIGELSIRLQFNQDELWTKALRYMLTNMKWILIFASRASVVVDS